MGGCETELAEPVAGLSQLSLHDRAFIGIPSRAERPGIGIERTLVQIDGLCVGGDSQSLIADREEVGLGSLPFLSTAVVVGEETCHIIDTLTGP